MNVKPATTATPSFRRRRLAGAALGAVAALLTAACDTSPSVEDARAYEKLLGERHALLGQVIILQGRLLESFVLNDAVLEDTHFIAAEEILAGRLERIGTVTDLRNFTLPSSSGGLQSLHDVFIESVDAIRESARLVDEGAYTAESFDRSERYWDSARLSYLDFTSTLLDYTGSGGDMMAGLPDGLPSAGAILHALGEDG